MKDIIVGRVTDIIDLETRANLTETARNDSRRELMASLGEDEVITFSPAEVKHTITVFTDVECTYCRRLHSQISEYLDKGIQVRYLLYPRNGPASKAWSTSEQVWCASDRNAALTAAKTDKDFESGECDATIVHYDWDSLSRSGHRILYPFAPCFSIRDDEESCFRILRGTQLIGGNNRV